MFGKIPSIYEKEMREVTTYAQKTAKNKGEILSIMMNKADSAFTQASIKSQNDVQQLVDKEVEYKIDNDVNLSIKGGIKIQRVNLPDLRNVNGNMESVVLDCDVKTDENILYYLIEGTNGIIDSGSIGTAGEEVNGAHHLEMEIKAPNVPAKYQEDCKTIHFVTYQTYVDKQSVIEKNQQKWRDEYNKQMKLQ